MRARRAPRRSTHDDVLGMLVRAHDEAGHSLSDEQLLAHVNILLVAGHETTTTLGAWVLYLLARAAGVCRAHRGRAAVTVARRRPQLTSEALHALPVLSAAIREAGRLQFAGAAAAARRAVGLRVRRLLGAGWHAACFWRSPPGIACRRSSDDPSASIRIASCRRARRTARTPYGLATFGGGPRICLGINFAQVEVMALIAHVLRHYRLSHVSAEPIREFGGLLPALPEGSRHARRGAVAVDERDTAFRISSRVETKPGGVGRPRISLVQATETQSQVRPWWAEAAAVSRHRRWKSDFSNRPLPPHSSYR